MGAVKQTRKECLSGCWLFFALLLQYMRGEPNVSDRIMFSNFGSNTRVKCLTAVFAEEDQEVDGMELRG